MRGLLDPKMDFVFKNIFGSEKHPNILISFLNATLKPKDLITEVEIKNTDLKKEVCITGRNYIQNSLMKVRIIVF